METIKFSNKRQSIKLTLFTIGLSIVAVFVLTSINFNVNKYLIFLLASIIYFLEILLVIKKASIQIKEIIIQEELVIFAFYNLRKKKRIIDKNKLNVIVDPARIIFKEKGDDKLIGIALRSQINEEKSWELLTNLSSK